MRKIYLMLMMTLLFCFVSGSYGAVIYQFFYDHIADGTVMPDGFSYPVGPSEIIAPGDGVFAQTVGGDGPQFRLTAALGAADPNGIVQGGMAMVTQSNGLDEGLEVRMAAAVPPGDITIEYIFFTTALALPGNTANLQYVGGTEWPFGGPFFWMLRLPTAFTPDGIFYFWSDKGDTLGQRVGSSNPINVMQWYHAVGVLDYNEGNPASSQIKLYLDGQLQGTSPYDASDNIWRLGCSSSPPPHTNIWTMGFSSALWGNPADHRGLDGAIDAVAISDTALTPQTFALHSYPPTAATLWTLY